MKLKGRISVRINREETIIEIEDEKANVTFIKAILTPEQLSAALSRQMSVECEIEVKGLDKVGKTHENKRLEFEIPNDLASSRNTEQLHSLAQSILTDGWVADKYFGSQDSFFKKGGVQYARCTIRRYI